MKSKRTKKLLWLKANFSFFKVEWFTTCPTSSLICAQLKNCTRVFNKMMVFRIKMHVVQSVTETVMMIHTNSKRDSITTTHTTRITNNHISISISANVLRSAYLIYSLKVSSSGFCRSASWFEMDNYHGKTSMAWPYTIHSFSWHENIHTTTSSIYTHICV